MTRREMGHICSIVQPSRRPPSLLVRSVLYSCGIELPWGLLCSQR